MNLEKGQFLDKSRKLVKISGTDAKKFLQGIITNNIDESIASLIYSALLTPQGKYLFDFFIAGLDEENFFIDIDLENYKGFLDRLNLYKLRSNVQFRDLSSEFVVGIINHEKFKELQVEIGSEDNTIYYRDTPIFSDPRNKRIGARILSNLEKLYMTVKKLDLKIIDSSEYYLLIYKIGIPEKGIKNLKDKLFGLEANFEELQAIDFKKGCFVGQENTARMKLKKKLRRRLLPLETSERLDVGAELKYENSKVGVILIAKPYPFGLINIVDPDLKEFENKELIANNKSCRILKSI